MICEKDHLNQSALSLARSWLRCRTYFWFTVAHLDLDHQSCSGPAGGILALYYKLCCSFADGTFYNEFLSAEQRNL